VPPDDTRALTAAVARGDAQATSRLYRERLGVMLAAARRASGRDESFCLDAVHDAMLKVIRSIPVLESERDLERWLARVVVRCVYDALRAERRRRERERASAVGGPTDDERVDPTEDPATSLAERERLAWLEGELARLDAQSQHLLTARFRLAHTLSMIGRSLGIGPGAADGRIARRTDALRAAAEEAGHD
jgi:RNA polymerase sigma factor (sigma-70 family)